MVSNRAQRPLRGILLSSSTQWTIVYGVDTDLKTADSSGGKWHPDAGHLSRIRHTIHHRPAKFKKPLLKPVFKKLFDGEAGLLTAEDRLKTAPKVLHFCIVR
jgi:uncharacterized protein (DUF2461 family)